MFNSQSISLMVPVNGPRGYQQSLNQADRKLAFPTLQKQKNGPQDARVCFGRGTLPLQTHKQTHMGGRGCHDPCILPALQKAFHGLFSITTSNQEINSGSSIKKGDPFLSSKKSQL